MANKKSNNLSEIYKAIEEDFNNSIPDIDIEKIFNNKIYRFFFNIKRKVLRNKFKNMFFIYNEKGFYYHAKHLAFQNLNKLNRKNESIKIFKGIFYKEKQIHNSYICRIIKNNNAFIKLYEIERLNFNDNYKIKISILPEVILIEMYKKESEDSANIRTRIIEIFQKENDLVVEKELAGIFNVNKENSYHDLQILIQQLRLVNTHEKMDILNYLLFGIEKKYIQQESDPYLLFNDHDLKSMTGKDVFCHLTKL